MTTNPIAEEPTDEGDPLPSDQPAGQVLIRFGLAVRNISLPPDLMGMYFLG